MKIVILGSCRFSPYDFLALPQKVPRLWNTELGYQVAAEKFHPAIDQADVVWVWAPDGVGDHTERDLEYARKAGKRIYVVIPLRSRIGLTRCVACGSDQAEYGFNRQLCGNCAVLWLHNMLESLPEPPKGAAQDEIDPENPFYHPEKRPAFLAKLGRILDEADEKRKQEGRTP